MTGNELLAIARNGRPNIRYEFNYKKTLLISNDICIKRTINHFDVTETQSVTIT